MKRLVMFALVIAAAWYGWKHYGELRGAGAHEIQVVNHSGQAVERVRVSVGGDVVVVEALEDGATAHAPWRSDHDGDFTVVWAVRGRDGEHTWRGGGFHPGPELTRYRFEFITEGRVVWDTEPLSPHPGGVPRE